MQNGSGKGAFQMGKKIAKGEPSSKSRRRTSIMLGLIKQARSCERTVPKPITDYKTDNILVAKLTCRWNDHMSIQTGYWCSVETMHFHDSQRSYSNKSTKEVVVSQLWCTRYRIGWKTAWRQ